MRGEIFNNPRKILDSYNAEHSISAPCSAIPGTDC